MRATKTIGLVACLILASHVAIFAQDGLHGIPWARDLKSAQETAIREKRLVLLHFWAPDCAPCDTVERYVFSHPEVARAIAANYVAVSVNAQALPDVAKRFGVDRWPTDVIISPEGEVFSRMVSPKDANQYMGMVNRVAVTRRVAPPGGSLLAPSSRQQPAATQVGAYQNGAPTTNLYVSPQSGSPEPRGTMRNPYLSGKGATSYTGNPYVDVTAPPRETELTTTQVPGGSFPSHTGAEESRPVSKLVANTQFQPNYQRNAGASPRGGAFGEPPAANLNPMASTAPRGGAFGEPAAIPGAFNPTADQNSFATRNKPESSLPNRTRGENSSPRGDKHLQVTSESPLEAPAVSPDKPLALSGYCPVTLVESQGWKRGTPEFGAIHRGRTYLFTGQREQSAFLADPDRYSPVLSGFDPVKFCERGEFVEGKWQHGVFFHDQIFLFADEPSLERFWKSPDAFAKIAQEAMVQNAVGNRKR